MFKLFGIDGLDNPQNRSVVRLGFVIALCAVVVRLVYWAYTGRVWEDALITLAHSENAIRGLGLTLPQGGSRFVANSNPPVQGFSSPLGLLLPLVGDYFSLGSGLTLLRAVSALAGGLTVLYILALAVHPAIRLTVPAAVLAMGYAAFEHHQIAWGMSGMETQLATLLLIASAYYLVQFIASSAAPEADPVRTGKYAFILGLTLGLCVLARPEFALWGVTAGLFVLVRDRRVFAITACAALGLYMPWLSFAWFYYGSPVPNTILAKAIGYPLWWKDGSLTLAVASRHLTARLSGVYLPNSIFQPLGPSFAGHGTHFSRTVGDHGAVCQAVLFFVVTGCGMALYRRRRGLLPLVAIAAVFIAYLTFAVPHVFGWYVAPLAAVLAVLAAYGLDATAALIPNRRARTTLAVGLVTAYLVLMAGMLPLTFETDKRIQHDIEDMARKPACQFLANVMGRNDTLASESLGHTAYYTRRQVYDWPGLASRRVVEYSRTHEHGRSLAPMINALRPDWLLLRPFEYEQAKRLGDWIDRDYQLVRRFKTLDCARDITLASRNIDFEFLVFKKKE